MSVTGNRVLAMRSTVASSVAIIASVEPQVTQSSVSGSTLQPE